MKNNLILILLISLNIISLVTLGFLMWSHYQSPVVFQEGLSTYFNNNELYIK